MSSPIKPFWTPDTLEGLRDEGIPLRALCKRCRRQVHLDIEALIDRYGPDKYWRSLRAACSECGARGSHVDIDAIIPWEKLR